MNQRAAIKLNFAGAKTGVDYRIDLVVNDANGNILMSGSILIDASADAEDIRTAIADALGDTGLDVIPSTTSSGLRLMSKGNKKLGTVTYDTFTDTGLPAPTYAGPNVVTRGGTAALKVDGTVVNP